MAKYMRNNLDLCEIYVTHTHKCSYTSISDENQVRCFVVAGFCNKSRFYR